MRVSTNLDMGMMLTPRAHFAGDYSEGVVDQISWALLTLIVESDSTKLPVGPVEEIRLIAG